MFPLHCAATFYFLLSTSQLIYLSTLLLLYPSCTKQASTSLPLLYQAGLYFP